jgi:hypothetical protein
VHVAGMTREDDRLELTGSGAVQDTSGAVTLQEFGAMEELLVNATQAGETMTFHDIISPVLFFLFVRVSSCTANSWPLLVFGALQWMLYLCHDLC